MAEPEIPEPDENAPARSQIGDLKYSTRWALVSLRLNERLCEGVERACVALERIAAAQEEIAGGG